MGKCSPTLAFLLMMVPLATNAGEICPKYGQCVPEEAFACSDITRSSLVGRVCYSAEKAYLVLKLRETYYHYCDVDPATVANLLSAPSMGSFYLHNIKDSATGGKFTCKGKTLPVF